MRRSLPGEDPPAAAGRGGPRAPGCCGGGGSGPSLPSRPCLPGSPCQPGRSGCYPPARRAPPPPHSDGSIAVFMLYGAHFCNLRANLAPEAIEAFERRTMRVGVRIAAPQRRASTLHGASPPAPAAVCRRCRHVARQLQQMRGTLQQEHCIGAILGRFAPAQLTCAVNLAPGGAMRRGHVIVHVCPGRGAGGAHLDVAVDVAVLVQVGQRLQHLLHDRGDHVLVQHLQSPGTQRFVAPSDSSPWIPATGRPGAPGEARADLGPPCLLAATRRVSRIASPMVHSSCRLEGLDRQSARQQIADRECKP